METLLFADEAVLGDELGGLSGVLLIVLVCVLATSLVWLLYLCCSNRKNEETGEIVPGLRVIGLCIRCDYIVFVLLFSDNPTKKPTIFG